MAACQNAGAGIAHRRDRTHHGISRRQAPAHHRACCPTARSPTASPGPATARAPSWPSAMSANASRTASPSSPPSSTPSWSSTATSATTRRSSALFAQLGEHWPAVRRLRARDRLRAARGDRRRLPRRPAREGFRIAHEISAYSFPALAKAALPRLRPGAALLTLSYLGADALRAELQHDGPGQGLAGGQRALPGAQPGRARRARQRHLGRADQDPGGIRHQGLRQAAVEPSQRRRRSAATSRSTTSATPPPSCCPTWPPASPPRSPTSTAASATWPSAARA